METGTLEQIGAMDGDKVCCISNIVNYEDGVRYNTFTSGKCYTFAPFGMIGDKDEVWPGVLPYCGEWRIISRATPTHDLTAITTPFGLLDETTQEALRAHGGPYERWMGDEWRGVFGAMSWFGDTVYRVKPGPLIETETMKIINAYGMPMAYATVTTRNGKPDWSTLQVNND